MARQNGNATTEIMEFLMQTGVSENMSQCFQLLINNGDLELTVPQTRNGGFYPSAIQKGVRSERALLTTIAEMYIQGVSTRKVTKILEELCDCQVSSS